MADQLATHAELAELLGVTVDEDRANLILQLATAEVQGVVRQRLVQVVDDPFEILGTTQAWLELPQRPVVAVSTVKIDDGDALVEGTDYKRFGARLWRACGWAEGWQEPSTITGTYTHGYAPGSQDLELARSAVLAIARTVYTNPGNVLSEAIDDYRVQFGALTAAALEAAPFLRMALQRKYGTGAGLVKVQ